MFLSEFTAATLAAVLSGILFLLIDNLNKQSELAALLIALENECKYNTIHRGFSKNPFQLYWLEKILANLSFHDQCKEIDKKGLNVLELAKEANLDQLGCRKMVTSNIQDEMSDLFFKVKKILPEIKRRTTVSGYIYWKINQIYCVIRKV